MDTEGKNWAVVMTPTHVLVRVAARADFDRIALPAKDHGARDALLPVITKTATDPGGVRVVFEHWYGTTPMVRLGAAQRLARQGTAGVAA